MGWKLVEVEETNKIQDKPVGIEQILGMRLSQFAKRSIAIQIYSEILGCELWLCSNEEMASQIKQDDPEAVIYTIAELKQLVMLNPDPESLKSIHNTKAVFSKSRLTRVNIEKKEPKEDDDSN